MVFFPLTRLIRSLRWARVSVSVIAKLLRLRETFEENDDLGAERAARVLGGLLDGNEQFWRQVDAYVPPLFIGRSGT